MELKIANDKDNELWDSLVDRSPHGTLFHTWRFLKIMEKHTKSRLYPIIGLKGTTPIGVYPIFLQKRFFLKMVFSPPPHCAVLYLGPAMADFDKIKQSRKETIFIDFQREVDSFIHSELKADYVSISTSPGLIDARPLKWCGYDVKPSCSYILNLTKGTDYVWSQLKKRLRQSINKTGRAGVSIEEGSMDELKSIYKLMGERYAEQNKIVTVPEEYLLDLYALFHPKNLKIFVAKYDREIKTGVITIQYKDKTIIWIGNAKTNLSRIAPNDLLFWETMKNANESGLKQYEMIGAAGVERLHSYCSKYNPELLLWFSATKYSSVIPKFLETFYTGILKPVYSKLKLVRLK